MVSGGFATLDFLLSVDCAWTRGKNNPNADGYPKNDPLIL